MSDPIAPLHPPDTFARQAESLNIAFDAGDLERLGLYLALLLDANTRFNLTGITDPEQAWTRHVFDSLTLVPVIASLEAKTIIDIGSGGGLPGIPLAIALPEMQVMLIEATGKKARFLSDVVARLALKNVKVIAERAETLGQDEHHRERYDIVLARAVGKLPTLLELTVPFANIGGHLLAMKGEKAPEEIAESKKALHMLHSHVIDSITTPTGTIVVIEKQRKTPHMYPRKPGEPKRAPLK